MSNKTTTVPSYEELDRRYQAAKANSDYWRPILLEIYEYAIPDRNLFTKMAPGQKKTTYVYDSTPCLAVNKFASNLQSSLVPPMRKWAKLKAGNKIRKEAHEELNQVLDSYTDIVFDYINRSNFAMAVNESFIDLAAGTGVLLLQENNDDENPLIFTSIPVNQISPEESAIGTIETIWRRFEDIPNRNILQLWPKAKLPDALRDKVKNEPDSKTTLIEGGIHFPENEPDKRYCYVVMSPSDKKVIYYEFSKSNRWIAFRWSKVPGEVFGRGPLTLMLSDIKTLNKVVEFTLIGAAMAVSPPYLGYEDGVFSPYTVQVKPNVIIPVSRMSSGNQAPLSPVPRNGDPEFGNLIIKDLQGKINMSLFGDALGPVDGPQMSATEVYTRQQQLLKLIGSAFGRLQVELLPKVIDRVIHILRKRGLIDKIELDGEEITLRYESPLSQAQNVDDVSALMQFIQELAVVQNSGVMVAGTMNVEKVPTYLAEKLGIPLELVKKPEEVKEVIDKAVQSMQPPQQEQFGLPQDLVQQPQGQ